MAGSKSGNVELTLTVCEANSKCLSLRFALTHISADIPDPASITSDIRRQLHIRGHYYAVRIDCKV